MNTNDKRYIKNEKLIRETFIEMLRNMKYNQITVNALCDKALISKHTFYSHYESKDELVKSLMDELLEGMMVFHNNYFSLACSNRAYSVNAEEVIGVQNTSYEYINSNLDKFYAFFKNDNTISFSQRMAFFVRNEMIRKIKTTKNNEIQIYMLIDYMAQGDVSIIKNWVLNKDKITLKEVEEFSKEMLSSMHIGITKKYMEVIDKNYYK